MEQKVTLSCVDAAGTLFVLTCNRVFARYPVCGQLGLLWGDTWSRDSRRPCTRPHLDAFSGTTRRIRDSHLPSPAYNRPSPLRIPRWRRPFSPFLDYPTFPRRVRLACHSIRGSSCNHAVAFWSTAISCVRMGPAIRASICLVSRRSRHMC